LSIDLDTTEGRKKYLSEKLDDLLDGINDSYGTLLMEELLTRLELTVKDFNEEMKALCDQLIKKEKERQQLLEMIKSTDGLLTPDAGVNSEEVSQDLETPPVVTDEPEEDVPEWEKKLAKLEKK